MMHSDVHWKVCLPIYVFLFTSSATCLQSDGQGVSIQELCTINSQVALTSVVSGAQPVVYNNVALFFSREIILCKFS